MNSFKYPKIVLWCLVCFMVAFFASNRLFRGDPAGWRLIISSDGLGYYAYLPALLIEHNLTYKDVIQREKKILGYKRYQPAYLEKYGDRVVNKYFAGEALLLLPFFLLASFFSWISGIDITGYNFFFQLFAGLGALFYLFLGLFYLKKILDYFGIRPVLSAIILTAILLGTNLFYYSLWQPTMSHVYSFFAINGVLWYFCQSIQKPKLKYLLLSGLFLGITVLIRPTNGIVIILVPFLIRNVEEAREFAAYLLKKKSSILLFLAAFFAIVFIQPILWKLQTGHWFIWSYRDEGFLFGNPQVSNVLFSYRKGLFIYTPLILLSLPGMFRLGFRKPGRLFSLVIFLILSTYIIASWWNWYYGDSFGARAFLDYYGIFAILLAILLNSRPTRTRSALVILLLFPFVVLNLLQTWQYTHSIIHPNSMNKAKYGYVFLKTDSVYMGCLGGIYEIPDYTTDMVHPCKSYFTSFERPSQVWKNSFNIRVTNAHTGRFSGILDSLHQYSATLEIKPDTISPYPVTFYLEGNVWIRDSIKGGSDKVMFVISMDSIDPQGNYWLGIPVNDIPDNPVGVWRNCRFAMTLPEFRIPGRTLKVYLWNSGKEAVMLDDFFLVFFTEKKKSAGK